MNASYIGLDKQNCDHKIVNVFLPISFNICLECSKELSNWDGSFDTHNICFS